METFMKVDSSLVRQLREEKSWSQEHLATVAGVSLRTIQRVESDGTASPETRMAVASALDVSASDLGSKQSRPAPVTLGHKLGLAFGFAGAAAGLLFAWLGVASNEPIGQSAGIAYGTMASFTGVICAALGVLANHVRRSAR